MQRAWRDVWRCLRAWLHMARGTLVGLCVTRVRPSQRRFFGEQKEAPATLELLKVLPGDVMGDLYAEALASV